MPQSLARAASMAQNPPPRDLAEVQAVIDEESGELRPRRADERTIGEGIEHNRDCSSGEEHTEREQSSEEGLRSRGKDIGRAPSRLISRKRPKSNTVA